MAKTCKYCKAPIIFVSVAGGGYMPCQVKPVYYIKDSSRPLQFITTRGELVKGRRVEDKYRATGMAYVSHWPYCNRKSNRGDRTHE